MFIPTFHSTLSLWLFLCFLSTPQKLLAIEDKEPGTPFTTHSRQTETEPTAAVMTDQTTTSANALRWGKAVESHAPLAFFSVGSLAVGGILIGIRAENQSKMNWNPKSPDRDLAWALGLASASAIVAGGAFWYYVRSDLMAENPTDNAQWSLLPTWDGDFGVSASISLPFALF